MVIRKKKCCSFHPTIQFIRQFRRFLVKTSVPFSLHCSVRISKLSIEMMNRVVQHGKLSGICRKWKKVICRDESGIELQDESSMKQVYNQQKETKLWEVALTGERFGEDLKLKPIQFNQIFHSAKFCGWQTKQTSSQVRTPVFKLEINC